MPVSNLIISKSFIPYLVMLNYEDYNQTLQDYQDLMNFIRFYPMIHYANAIITLFMYPLMLYLIVMKSPKGNAGIKWRLSNLITTSLLNVLGYAFWQPVILFPHIAGFSMGIANHWEGMGKWFLVVRSLGSAQARTFYRTESTIAYNLSYEVIVRS